MKISFFKKHLGAVLFSVFLTIFSGYSNPKSPIENTYPIIGNSKELHEDNHAVDFETNQVAEVTGVKFEPVFNKATKVIVASFSKNYQLL